MSRDEFEELIAKNQDDADLVGAYKSLISSEQMLKEFVKEVCTNCIKLILRVISNI